MQKSIERIPFLYASDIPAKRTERSLRSLRELRGVKVMPAPA